MDPSKELSLQPPKFFCVVEHVKPPLDKTTNQLVVVHSNGHEGLLSNTFPIGSGSRHEHDCAGSTSYKHSRPTRGAFGQSWTDAEPQNSLVGKDTEQGTQRNSQNF